MVLVGEFDVLSSLWGIPVRSKDITLELKVLQDILILLFAMRTT